MRRIRSYATVRGPAVVPLEFARAVNVDRSRLNKIIINNSFEGGLSLATVDKLCAVLDCQPGEILEYRPEE